MSSNPSDYAMGFKGLEPSSSSNDRSVSMQACVPNKGSYSPNIWQCLILMWLSVLNKHLHRQTSPLKVYHTHRHNSKRISWNCPRLHLSRPPVNLTTETQAPTTVSCIMMHLCKLSHFGWKGSPYDKTSIGQTSWWVTLHPTTMAEGSSWGWRYRNAHGVSKKERGHSVYSVCVLQNFGGI